MIKWTVIDVNQQSKEDNWNLVSISSSSHLLVFWPLETGPCLFKFAVLSMLPVCLATIHKC